MRNNETIEETATASDLLHFRCWSGKFKITSNKKLNFLGQNVATILLSLAPITLPRTR